MCFLISIMEFNNKQVTIIHYSNDWHDKLLSFMKREYPSRAEEYLEYCLDYLDNATSDVKDKAVIALINSEIVGCYTVLPLRIMNSGYREDYYIQMNMIVSPQYRGYGISSLLYYYWDYYPNWLVTGFTELAWKIAPHKVKSFRPISPIYVYLMFNRWFFITVLKRLKLMGKFACLKPFPENLKKSSLTINRAHKPSEIFFPDLDRWLQCDCEIVRDPQYLDERFFRHYRNNEYVVYSLYKNNQPIGYFVVRATEYNGFQLLSLVDFRYVKGGSVVDVLRAVAYIAKVTHYGMVIVLTSLKWSRLTAFPFVLRTTKELLCATGVENLSNQTNIFFTSADSDLDYVYYK